MTYYDRFLEEYTALEHPVPFWDFIGLTRKHSVAWDNQALRLAYTKYFLEHEEESAERLAPEILLYLQNKKHAFDRPPIRQMIGAKERIHLSCYVMVKPEFTDQQFEDFWGSPVIQENMLIRVPDNNQLGTMHVLLRVHIVVCHLHQKHVEGWEKV